MVWLLGGLVLALFIKGPRLTLVLPCSDRPHQPVPHVLSMWGVRPCRYSLALQCSFCTKLSPASFSSSSFSVAWLNCCRIFSCMVMINYSTLQRPSRKTKGVGITNPEEHLRGRIRVVTSPPLTDGRTLPLFDHWWQVAEKSSLWVTTSPWRSLFSSLYLSSRNRTRDYTHACLFARW